MYFVSDLCKITDKKYIYKSVNVFVVPTPH